MRAWSVPTYPDALPWDPSTAGPPVRVYDSATGTLQLTRPDGPARLYVCGITPYDATHLGHAATYVAFDLLLRAWRSAGHPVRYVQNVTDVDDPLLQRAAQTGEDWRELAESQVELFRGDMEALRVFPPDHYTTAVEAIPRLLELIGELDEAGAVYRVDDDVYFSVGADQAFGHVSGWTREEMLRVFPDRGGDPDRPGKRDPLDALLWRAERPGEPSWPSPYGPGRPGWHIECAAIAVDHLGAGFDVQGGGSDLVFPHHEMSASHAHVADGDHPFARAYVHAGMVGLEGEKMSKSLGNLVFVSRLVAEGRDPMAVRLALLAHHYRTDWTWSEAELEQAEERLARWREAVSQDAGPHATATVAGVLAALADDVDAPTALAVVDAWVEQALDHGAGSGSAPDDVRRVVDAALGVDL